jgi:hypothetical protein
MIPAKKRVRNNFPKIESGESLAGTSTAQIRHFRIVVLPELRGACSSLP